MERLKIIGKTISSKNRLFSVGEISAETMIDPLNVQIVLDRLYREGLVQRFRLVSESASPLRGRPKKNVAYQVRNKKEFKERIAPRLKEDTAQDRVWQVIRCLRNFTRGDLIRIADVSVEIAVWFTKMLHRAGFVALSKRQGQGVHWRLIRDPGPRRPYLGHVIKKGQPANLSEICSGDLSSQHHKIHPGQFLKAAC